MVVLPVLALMVLARYLPSVRTELVADDWANLARSSFYASHEEAAWAGAQDPNRPLSMVAVEVVYRLFGTEALRWTLLSLAGNALLLLFAMKMALELTGRRFVAVAAGVMFALLPNLVETYHWSTQVLNEVACALAPYALSGWAWVAYVRRGGAWRLGLSAAAYGVALFSYEAGILLPAAYLALLPWRREPGKCVWRMVPIGVVGLLYVAWRATNAFGLQETSPYPPHMQAGLSLWAIGWNARQIVQWWAGDRFFGAMLNGFDAFASLAPWVRRLLVVGNGVAVGLAGWGLARLQASDRREEGGSSFSQAQAAGFALVWTGAALAIPLVSYTASRLMVLPAIGISLLVALALERWPVRRWGPVLFLPAVLAMVSNQGTAESWRQAGAVHRALYEHLRETHGEWRDKEVLLIDTRGVRHRQTRGLLQPLGEDELTWAHYGNALLIRGFVPKGMARLISGEKNPGIAVVHDVEYGARVEGDVLVWHERWNPSRPRTTPMADVFAVDCLDVAQEAE
jgi:hypothetical protein